MDSTITLSERTFKLLAEEAERVNRAPSELAEEVLARHFSPPHPYIEMAQTPSGSTAMIKGTRIPVYIIIGYLQRAGETPESLAKEVLPHVSLAAIYDALSYYYDHKAEIDQECAENTEVAGRQHLRERLGEERYRRLTGQGR
jgi:uncharacterized protein (DUF433 family)